MKEVSEAMTIKKISLLLTSLVFTTLLSGCMEPVELSKMGIVMGLGIDKVDGQYTVTMQTINASGVTGDNPNILPIYSMHVGGENMLTTTQMLSNLSTQVLYYSHLKAIVVHEDVAREDGLETLMDFIIRNTEIRPDVTLCIARNASSKEVLNVLTAVEQIPMNKLDALNNLNRRRSGMLSSYNLYEVMDLVHSDGINLVLNAVSIRQEEEHLPHAQQDSERQHQEDMITECEMHFSEEGRSAGNSSAPHESQSEHNSVDAGNEGPTRQNIDEITSPADIKIEELAVFDGYKLIGYLDPVDSQMYNMLRGANKRYWGYMNLEGDEYFLAMLITDLNAKTTPFLVENKVIIEMDIKGQLLEGDYNFNLTNTTNLEEMERLFEEDIEKEAEKFLEKLQTEFKVDILGIGREAYSTDYKLWRQHSAFWEEQFPQLQIEVKASVSIYSTGEIKNYHNVQ